MRELEAVVREGEAERSRLVAALCELQHLYDMRACGGTMVPSGVATAAGAASSGGGGGNKGVGAVAGASGGVGAVGDGVGAAMPEGGPPGCGVGGGEAGILDALPPPHHECACPWEAWAAAGASFGASDEAVREVLAGAGGVLPPLPPELGDVQDLLPGIASDGGGGGAPGGLGLESLGPPAGATGVDSGQR